MDTEELINALKIIRDECDANMGCRKCPFGDANGACKIMTIIPANWVINEDADIWRALK